MPRGKVQSPTSWLSPTSLALCSSETTRSSLVMLRGASTALSADRPPQQHLHFSGQPGNGSFSSAQQWPGLEVLLERRQARQLAEKPGAGPIPDGGRISQVPSPHGGQGTTCPVNSLSGIWLQRLASSWGHYTFLPAAFKTGSPTFLHCFCFCFFFPSPCLLLSRTHKAV